MFQGFPPQAVDFLWGLRFNNDRGWFEPRKQQFRELVDQPMRELALQTQQAMLEKYPRQQLEMRVCRIYRDARRLHGRGPYKDHLWFVIHRPVDGGMGALPCFYFELAPERHSMGMGYWSATPLTMAKFRARVDRDPNPMEKLARRIARQDRFVLEGERYARPKKDVGKLLDPWYNRKNLSLNWDRNCEGSLFTPELAGELLDGFTFLMPYYLYFDSLDSERPPEEP